MTHHYDVEHTIVLTVGGNNDTGYLKVESLDINDVLTKQIDTCKFTLQDTDGGLVAPVAWDIVTVVEGGTDFFGGFVTRVERVAEPTLLEYHCHCQDFTVLLETEAVNASFTNQTDAAIIAVIFAGLVAGDGFDATTHVGSSGTLDHIRFNRTSLLNAMRQISERTGWDWYIGYDKAVHYFNPAAGAAAAPFSLTDTDDPPNVFLRLNGTDAIVSGGSDPTLDNIPNGGAFTAELWLRFGAVLDYVLGKGINEGWRIYWSGGNLYARVNCGGVDALVLISGTINDGAWHHVAITYDDVGDRKIYAWVDGVHLATSAAGVGAYVLDAARILAIGDDYNRGDPTEMDLNWYRYSDSIRYTTAFTPLGRYNPPASDGNTVQLFHVDEGSGTALDNEQGDPNRDGLIVNGEWMNEYPYDVASLRVAADGEDIRNRVYVYGGTYEKGGFTQEWVADGEQQEFWMSYVPITVSGVTLDGIVQTYGVDFVDDPNAYDCLINYHEKVIRFYQRVPLVGEIVACTYSYKVPIAVVRVDAASVAAYGRYFDHSIVDPKITTVQEATDVGDAMLAEYANPKVKGRISTRRSGLRSGQVVDVTNVLLGLVAQSYLIQRVRKGFFGQKFFHLELELGKFQLDVIDLLLKMKQDQRDYLEERPDEVLRMILSMTVEDTDVAEDALTVTLLPTEAYLWALSGGQDLIWSAGTWG